VNIESSAKARDLAINVQRSGAREVEVKVKVKVD